MEGLDGDPPPAGLDLPGGQLLYTRGEDGKLTPMGLQDLQAFIKSLPPAGEAAAEGAHDEGPTAGGGSCPKKDSSHEEEASATGPCPPATGGEADDSSSAHEDELTDWETISTGLHGSDGEASVLNVRVSEASQQALQSMQGKDSETPPLSANALSPIVEAFEEVKRTLTCMHTLLRAKVDLDSQLRAFNDLKPTEPEHVASVELQRNMQEVLRTKVLESWQASLASVEGTGFLRNDDVPELLWNSLKYGQRSFFERLRATPAAVRNEVKLSGSQPKVRRARQGLFLSGTRALQGAAAEAAEAKAGAPEEDAPAESDMAKEEAARQEPLVEGKVDLEEEPETCLAFAHVPEAAAPAAADDGKASEHASSRSSLDAGDGWGNRPALDAADPEERAPEKPAELQPDQQPLELPKAPPAVPPAPSPKPVPQAAPPRQQEEVRKVLHFVTGEGSWGGKPGQPSGQGSQRPPRQRGGHQDHRAWDANSAANQAWWNQHYSKSSRSGWTDKGWSDRNGQQEWQNSKSRDSKWGDSRQESKWKPWQERQSEWRDDRPSAQAEEVDVHEMLRQDRAEQPTCLRREREDAGDKERNFLSREYTFPSGGYSPGISGKTAEQLFDFFSEELRQSGRLSSTETRDYRYSGAITRAVKAMFLTRIPACLDLVRQCFENCSELTRAMRPERSRGETINTMLDDLASGTFFRLLFEHKLEFLLWLEEVANRLRLGVGDEEHRRTYEYLVSTIDRLCHSCEAPGSDSIVRLADRMRDGMPSSELRKLMGRFLPVDPMKREWSDVIRRLARYLTKLEHDIWGKLLRLTQANCADAVGAADMERLSGHFVTWRTAGLAADYFRLGSATSFALSVLSQHGHEGTGTLRQELYVPHRREDLMHELVSGFQAEWVRQSQGRHLTRAVPFPTNQLYTLDVPDERIPTEPPPGVRLRPEYNIRDRERLAEGNPERVLGPRREFQRSLPRERYCGDWEERYAGSQPASLQRPYSDYPTAMRQQPGFSFGTPHSRGDFRMSGIDLQPGPAFYPPHHPHERVVYVQAASGYEPPSRRDDRRSDRYVDDDESMESGDEYGERRGRRPPPRSKRGGRTDNHGRHSCRRGERDGDVSEGFGSDDPPDRRKRKQDRRGGRSVRA